MDWLQMAQQRRDEMVKDLQTLVRINSVLDEATMTEEVPYGDGPLEALNWMLDQGKKENMHVVNLANKVGYVEMGQGEEMVGILCHVDVVPAGSDWIHEPFGAEIEDGKLYGRGAIDDKGPTMAAWLAMKMVHDAGIPLDRRVRLIVGSDEETGFRCVTHYMENDEVPTLGFAPDAEFPIINAEKGIAELTFRQQSMEDNHEQLRKFNAGHRINMVPDFAEAEIIAPSEEIVQQFTTYLEEQQLKGHVDVQGERVHLTVKGVSAHAMEPNNGTNAALKLAQFLAPRIETETSKQFLTFLTTAFGQETRGHALGLAFTDDISGDTTFNAGVVEFEAGRIGEIRVSMRYSVSYPFDEFMEKGRTNLQQHQFELIIDDDSKPHYVGPEEELIQKLSAVYERNTGEKTELIAMGGGTYAREMPNGVAFGMLFPGEPELAHQHDEYVVIDNMVKAAAIYADAIVELATKNK